MKVKHLFAFAAVGLMFAACAKNEVVDNGGDDNLGNGAVVTIELQNNVTRADITPEAGSDDENRISSLEFFVFTSDGKLDLYKPVTSRATTHKFVVPNPGDNMKFLVSVNQTIGDPEELEDWDDVAKISDFDFVRAQLAKADTFEAYEKGDNTKGNTLVTPSAYPMSGYKVQSVTAPSTTNQSPNTAVRLTVSRLVSKVEAPAVAAAGVEVTLDNKALTDLMGLDEAITVSEKTWAMDGFVFINGVDNTDAFNNWNAAGDETSAWDTWNSDNSKISLVSAFAADDSYTKVYGGSSDNDMFINGGTTFAYENEPTDDSADVLYWDRNTVYSFILKGTFTLTYEDPANQGVLTETETRYWRANLIPDDDHRVHRNTIYRLTVSGVNTIGYGTPKEAEEEAVPKKGNASVTVIIDVAKWNVKLTNTIL